MKDHTQLLEAYFRDLLATRQTGGGVKEESYYDALANLLTGAGNGLKPRVRCILQLGNRGAGRPDGGLFTEEQWKQGDSKKPLLGLPQPPNRGAIEVKPTGDDAWVTSDTKQVSSYWQHYRLVLVTNYRDFILVGQDQDGNSVKLETYRLAVSETDFWLRVSHPRAFAKQHAATFTEFLQRVMLHAAPLTAPRDVAWFLASYARTAMARIEGQELPALTAVRSALEEALGLKFVGDKGEHFFRSTFVQTLFYGVFSAWVLWCKGRPMTSKEQFRWHDTALHLRVPIVQKLFYMMAEPAALRSLGLVEVMEWAANVLSRVDRASFFSAFEEGRAVQYFYEPFLEAFDPELRKELGVWYTPPEIVQYMVARIDRVLREELGLPTGLADPNVYVLDPCCGTGSYLVEVLRCIHRTLRTTRGDALVGADVKAAAMGRVFGFEILPAPFVVSHLQLGLLLQNLGAPLAEGKNERAGVYLTNALTGWEPLDPEKEKAFQAMLKGFPELLEERDSAREVKREKPILVILGNPPYNAFAGTSPAEEQGLVEPYKEGLVKEWSIKKFNLDDLYVRFFRLAERRIAEQTGRGVVSYISNYSWLSDPSFLVLRKHLLESFDKFWIENLHGNRRISEYTPDGRTSETVFAQRGFSPGIKQGVATSLWVKTGQTGPGPVVLFRNDIDAARAEERRAALLESLKDQDFDERYQAVHPTKENRYSFRPDQVSDAYRNWPMLVDLCEFGPSLGILENRKDALVSIDRAALEQRMTRYFDSDVDWPLLQVSGMGIAQDFARFNARKTRERALSSEKFNTASVRRLLVRPMDVRWCYYTAFRPIWNEPRPDYVAQCWPGNLALVSRRKGVAEPEGVPFFVASTIGAQHGLHTDAYYVPVRLSAASQAPQGKTKNQTHFLDKVSSPSTPKANLSAPMLQYLASLGITGPDADAKTAGLVWMHALAIGYSPAYLTENRDGIRQNWPRIPLPKTREALEESALLGEQVAALLDSEKEVPSVTAGTVRPELQVVAAVTKEGGGQLQPKELALTAGWGHHGQNDVVMPGKGKLVERDHTPEEWQAIEAGAKMLGIPPEVALSKLGARTCDVYLNDVAYWRNIPKGVWEYVIGGYQVIKKWLSYREKEVLGRALKPEEVREITNMARRIVAIRLLEPALDANYKGCKSEPYLWRS